MHMGLRMAPLWGVENLHFGSLCFDFSLKSLSFPIVSLISGTGSITGYPLPCRLHWTDTDKTRARLGPKHFTAGVGRRGL